MMFNLIFHLKILKLIKIKWKLHKQLEGDFKMTLNKCEIANLNIKE